MARLEEIQRLIGKGHSNRQIARMLRCRADMVSKVRSNKLDSIQLQRMQLSIGRLPPAWTLKVNWDEVEREIRSGFENTRIWEDYASEVVSHSNFYKYTRKRFAFLLEKTVTLREFKAGEYAEVDYAGDRIQWLDSKGGIHEAHVFIGILCFRSADLCLGIGERKEGKLAFSSSENAGILWRSS